MKSSSSLFTLLTPEESHKILSQGQITSTGFLCDDCFGEIQKSDQGKFVIFWCSCYARGFEADSPRAASLTQEKWRTFREASIGRKALNTPIVNPARSPNYDCWCPGCGRERKQAIFAVWTSNSEQYVCSYGVCRACGERMKNLSEATRSKEADKITERLLGRYPFLQKRLDMAEGNQ
jgi:hypothetical protein